MEEVKKPEQPAGNATPTKETEICKICNQAIPAGAASYANNVPFCPACRDKTIFALKTQEAGGVDMVPAILGGCAAAIVAGITWGLIVIWANYEIGIVAIGVGILAGYGVFWATGKKRGQSLQLIASATSILGIFIGKYIIFYHFFRKGAEEYIKAHPEEFDAPLSEVMNQFSLFSSRVISSFFSNISEMLSGYDILWIILAIGAAYKIPAMLKVQFTQTKDSITVK